MLGPHCLHQTLDRCKRGKYSHCPCARTPDIFFFYIFFIILSEKIKIDFTITHFEQYGDFKMETEWNAADCSDESCATFRKENNKLNVQGYRRRPYKTIRRIA